MEAFWKPIN